MTNLQLIKDKIKCWIVFSDEFPAGLVYQNRDDALEASKDERDADNKAYTRVKYFTKEELEALEEAD
jgi:hypothetical protein